MAHLEVVGSVETILWTNAIVLGRTSDAWLPSSAVHGLSQAFLRQPAQPVNI